MEHGAASSQVVGCKGMPECVESSDGRLPNET
jgi:hypothetical protein